MDNLVNSLGIKEGIAAQVDCYDPVNKVENGAKCRYSTGSGAPSGDPHGSRGGDGSVLISW